MSKQVGREGGTHDDGWWCRMVVVVVVEQAGGHWAGRDARMMMVRVQDGGSGD